MHGTPRTRALVVVLLGLAPWTVVFVGDELTLVFLYGFVNTNPLAFVSVPELLARGGGLPRRPLLLPASGLVYAGATASALAGFVEREDGRVTGYLLVLAALAGFGVAFAVLHRVRYTPLPVGPLLALAVAWWFYWPAMRRPVAAPD
jgi:uncharacterized protein (TIGR04206 family)